MCPLLAPFFAAFGGSERSGSSPGRVTRRGLPSIDLSIESTKLRRLNCGPEHLAMAGESFDEWRVDELSPSR